MNCSMRLMCATVFVLAGCAAQTPEEQISRAQTVRVCTGDLCVEQDRRVSTLPAALPEDPRIQALTEVAERNPDAAYDLGLRLLRGDGIPRNSYQALEWLRKAGDHGHAQAQLALGRIYLMGFEEMGPDPAEAESWLMRAASGGNKEARDLIPQAQKAKKDEHNAYRVREAYRNSWTTWYTKSPYYWIWRGTAWYRR